MRLEEQTRPSESPSETFRLKVLPNNISSRVPKASISITLLTSLKFMTLSLHLACCGCHLLFFTSTHSDTASGRNIDSGRPALTSSQQLTSDNNLTKESFRAFGLSSLRVATFGRLRTEPNITMNLVRYNCSVSNLVWHEFAPGWCLAGGVNWMRKRLNTIEGKELE